jgi:hypothetical protein
MGHLTKRAIGWTAPLALVAAAGLAACGDGDTTTAETAGVATGTMGSDVHLQNQAADIGGRAASVTGSDVHLQNQAADIGGRVSTETSGTSSVSSERAAAIEHDTHLAGNAATYGADDTETSNDEFVPGTRHMPLR